MFVLIGVRDTIPVAPKTFQIAPALAIRDSLNAKYANKLVPEKGLALSIFDILTAEDGRVTWGNGMMYYKVSFRLMLFAPFIGEVIVGKVLAVSKSYIQISLGFFRDIYIVPSLLPPNSAYDTVEEKYFWCSDDDDRILTQAELMRVEVSSRLYIDVGESIRFRVDSIEWQDIRPPPVVSQFGAAADGDAAVDEKTPIEKAGFKILATIAESGLGVTSWWTQEEEQEGEEDEKME